MVEVSTWQHRDRPVRAYVSAAHACDELIRLRGLVVGLAAFDYERAAGVQVRGVPGNPHLDQMCEVWELERIFAAVMRRSVPRRWEHWCRVRAAGESIRNFRGVPKSTVQRDVAIVDSDVEAELSARHRLAVIVR